MMIDITGVELIPGNGGTDCPGNGKCLDDNGTSIECCCEECDYMKCCFETEWQEMCRNCTDDRCFRKTKGQL